MIMTGVETLKEALVCVVGIHRTDGFIEELEDHLEKRGEPDWFVVCEDDAETGYRWIEAMYDDEVSTPIHISNFKRIKNARF